MKTANLKNKSVCIDRLVVESHCRDGDQVRDARGLAWGRCGREPLVTEQFFLAGGAACTDPHAIKLHPSTHTYTHTNTGKTGELFVLMPTSWFPYCAADVQDVVTGGTG